MSLSFPMNTTYAITHFWTPLELFLRLKEMYPSGEIRPITSTCVVFLVKEPNLEESWHLNNYLCEQWYEITGETPNQRGEEE